MGWLYILYTVFLLLVLLFIVGEKSNRRSKALWGYVLTYVVSFFYYRTFSVYGLIGLNFIYLGDTNGIISTVMLFLPPLYVVCMIPRIWKTLRAADQAYVAEEQRKRDRAFYEECKKFGIHRVSDLKKPENQQRFRLLAAKHKMEKLTEKELEDLLDRCAAAYREEKAAEAAEKKRQGQAAEELKYQQLTRYAGLHGADKPLQMLKDIQSGLVRGTSDLRLVPLKKESDGAVMAGTAAGIGGVIPAAMSFSNTERVNQGIREHNEQANAINQANVPVILLAQDRARQYREAAEKIPLKLIAEPPAEELFARLTFGEPTVKVSQFGSVTVQVSVKADKDLTIFDKLPAFIDGSVTAEIYDGEEKIGEAVLVFPAFGSMTYRLEEERYRDGYVSVKGLRTERGRTVKLEGMCLNCGEKGKAYTVKLVPRDLWAMER